MTKFIISYILAYNLQIYAAATSPPNSTSLPDWLCSLQFIRCPSVEKIAMTSSHPLLPPLELLPLRILRYALYSQLFSRLACQYIVVSLPLLLAVLLLSVLLLSVLQ